MQPLFKIFIFSYIYRFALALIYSAKGSETKQRVY